LAKAYPHLVKYDVVTPAAFSDVAPSGEPASEAFVSPVHDFFLTNPIARASRVMAECSALASARLAQAAE
jgi:NADH-quinone oxidoreductase subunit G